MAKAAPKVQVLKNDSGLEASNLMARAFLADPVYQYLLPNKKSYERRLKWMMRFMLRICPYRGVVHCVGEPLQGIAAWLKPGEKVSFLDEVKAGVLSAPFHLGIRSAWRSNSIMAETRKNRTRLSEGKHYWYLWQFAVAPESRGKGYGRALLQPVLEEADAMGIDCWLDNSNAANIPIYEALGFRTVEEYTIENKKQIVKLWHMCRRAEKTKKKDR